MSSNIKFKSSFVLHMSLVINSVVTGLPFGHAKYSRRFCIYSANVIVFVPLIRIEIQKTKRHL